jgi:hypothetical protein
VPGIKINASNGGLRESCRYLKTEGHCSFNSSSYVTGHKMEEDEMDRK